MMTDDKDGIARPFLIAQQNMTKPGKGILAMDESNPTCGGRLEALGIENTEENRRRYRELLITTKGLGEYVGGAILFEETLYQSCKDGTTFVDALRAQGIYPGIKVDKGLRPLANSNGESWCQGLDGLAERAAEYYKQGARFCKWRTVVSIPAGPSKMAVTDAAYGLARYAAICQNAGLVPIVEPEILLDGDHDIDRNFEVASMVWAETFKYLADNGVMFDRMLLKPSMVAPGADCPKKSNAKGRCVHSQDAQRPRAAVHRGHHVLVRRFVRIGLHDVLERHEPATEPVARVLLLRARSPKHRFEDVRYGAGRSGGDRQGAGDPPHSRARELRGSTRRLRRHQVLHGRCLPIRLRLRVLECQTRY